MKGFVITENKLALKNIEIPTPKFDEVLIKVAYSPIKRSDCSFAKQLLVNNNPLSQISLGQEGSGIVTAYGGSL